MQVLRDRPGLPQGRDEPGADVSLAAPREPGPRGPQQRRDHESVLPIKLDRKRRPEQESPVPPELTLPLSRR